LVSSSFAAKNRLFACFFRFAKLQLFSIMAKFIFER